MITRAQLRDWDACYSDEQIAQLVPKSGLTPLQVCDMGIPAEDRLWVLLRPEVLGDSFGSVLATIVERALDRANVTDPRSWDVVMALREGRVPDVAAAWAAWGTAWAAWGTVCATVCAPAAAAEARAARAAAWAAEAAALAKADAAEAAAWAAKAEAAKAAARAAAATAADERQAQLDHVRRALGGAL